MNKLKQIGHAIGQVFLKSLLALIEGLRFTIVGLIRLIFARMTKNLVNASLVLMAFNALGSQSNSLFVHILVILIGITFIVDLWIPKPVETVSEPVEDDLEEARAKATRFVVFPETMTREQAERDNKAYTVPAEPGGYVSVPFGYTAELRTPTLASLGKDGSITVSKGGDQ